MRKLRFRLVTVTGAAALAAAVFAAPTSAQAGPCTTAPAGPSCQAYLIGTVVNTVENVDEEVTEVRNDAFAAVRTAEDLVDQLGNDTVCEQVFEREDCFNF